MAAAWTSLIDPLYTVNWYCIHTKPLREKNAIEQLGSVFGVEVYFPLVNILKTIRRVRRTVTEPLFPRYVFCRFDIGSSYRAVRYSHDVVNLVRFGEKPAVVDDQLIDDLKAWASEDRILTCEPSLVVGDLVQIAEGPMQGLQAVILESRNDNERVAVLLSILGNYARLTINRQQLAKAV